MLRLEALTAGYDVPVVYEVSLELASGEIVAVIGPNGAGKSTVLKAVLGEARVTGGRILLGEEDVTGLPTHQRIARGLGYVPQGRIVFPSMTVEENLVMGAWAIRHDRARVRRNLQRMYELFPRLAERRRQAAGTMSGGEQQMVAIARALMAEPRIVLMDEPTLGLSPRFMGVIFATIRRLRDELGVGVLLVEQNAAQALRVADRGYVLELGRVRFAGPAAELLADERVRGLYVGLA